MFIFGIRSTTVPEAVKMRPPSGANTALVTPPGMAPEGRERLAVPNPQPRCFVPSDGHDAGAVGRERRALDQACVALEGGEWLAFAVPYPHITRDRDRRRSSTSRTRASAAASTLASTRTRRPPPRLISINPVRTPPARGCSLVVEVGDSVDASAIRTAVKCGTTAAGTWLARDCRRLVNTKLAGIP
jgi:hypothetical protein